MFKVYKEKKMFDVCINMPYYQVMKKEITVS